MSENRIHINSIQIPSRFFFAPINTGFCIDGNPTPRLIDFHHQRSGKSIGISYLGNVSISENFTTNSGTLVLRQNHNVWRDVASGITKNGSLSGIQLACRYYDVPASRKWSSRSPHSQVSEYRKFLNNLKTHDIDKIFKEFFIASKTAADYGFDVIQIHAAHGYFLSALLCKTLNKRKDKYSFENTGNLPDLLIKVKQELGEIVLDVRISSIDGIHDDAIEEWGSRRAQAVDIAGAGVDIISLSAGLYDFSKNLIYPSKKDGPNVYLEYCLDLAKTIPDTLISISGNIRDLKQISLLPDNIAFGIGRPLIADPSFISKSLSENESTITQCSWSGHCHYYTRNKPHISCKENPDI